MRYRGAQDPLPACERGQVARMQLPRPRASSTGDPDLIAFLGDSPSGTPSRNFAQGLAEPARKRRATLDQLIGVSAIVEEGSPLAQAEDAFRSGWKWACPAR